MHDDILTRLNILAGRAEENPIDERLDKMQNEIDQKAERSDVARASGELDRRISKKLDYDDYLKSSIFNEYKIDTSNIIQQIEKELGEKLNREEIEKVELGIRSEMEILDRLIQSKADKADLANLDTMTSAEIELRISQVKRQILSELKKRLEKIGGGGTVIRRVDSSSGAAGQTAFLANPVSLKEGGYYYFGGDESSGDWKVNRYLASDVNTIESAIEVDNSIYETLDGAWTNRSSLVYNA